MLKVLFSEVARLEAEFSRTLTMVRAAVRAADVTGETA
jgi:hypothetical protein